MNVRVMIDGTTSFIADPEGIIIQKSGLRISLTKEETTELVSWLVGSIMVTSLAKSLR